MTITSTPGPARRTTGPGAATAYGVLSVVAAVVSTAVALVIPGQIGSVIGALADGHSADRPLQALGLLVAAAVAGNVCNAFATGAYVAVRTASARRELASSMITRPSGLRTADLVTRLLVDARQPAARLPILTAISLSAVSLVGALTLLGSIDWVLLVGVLAGLLMIALLLRRLIEDLSDLLKRYRQALGDVGQRLLDAQAGAVTIRASGTWLAEARRVLVPMREVRALGEGLWAAQRGFAWRTSIFVPSMLLVTVAVGGWALAAGRVDVGEYAAAVGYTFLVLGSLDGIESAAGLGAVRAARARLGDVPVIPADLLEEGGSVLRPPAGTSGAPAEVVLDRVTLLGDDGRLLLDSVSATLPAGALVAITGPSGSGRSALAAVIAGQTAPTGGQVLVDGRPVLERDLFDHRRRPTLGYPRPALLGSTIGGMVSLGVAADGDTVREAARQAHILDVIDALPLGFETPVTDVELSGGELQRLAIAQAFARDSSLLVLDDVTVSLDAATEREVLGALVAARSSRTCVVVTNRDAVLRRADVVLTMEGGRLGVSSGEVVHP